MSSISIHAPRVGSDRVKAVFLGLCFQFQSTLPVWGATFWICPAATQLLYFNPRSPCGERRGVGSYNGLTPLFQSTLPVWGATTSSGLAKFSSRKFQSTLPVWGATEEFSIGRLHKNISIHAPRVGSDSKAAQIFLLHLRQKGYFFVIFSKLGAIFRGLAEKGGGISFLDRCEPPGGNMGTWRSRSENQGVFGRIGGFTAKVFYFLFVLIAKVVES